METTRRAATEMGDDSYIVIPRYLFPAKSGIIKKQHSDSVYDECGQMFRLPGELEDISKDEFNERLNSTRVAMLKHFRYFIVNATIKYAKDELMWQMPNNSDKPNTWKDLLTIVADKKAWKTDARKMAIKMLLHDRFEKEADYWLRKEVVAYMELKKWSYRVSETNTHCSILTLVKMNRHDYIGDPMVNTMLKFHGEAICTSTKQSKGEKYVFRKLIGGRGFIKRLKTTMVNEDVDNNAWENERMMLTKKITDLEDAWEEERVVFKRKITDLEEAVRIESHKVRKLNEKIETITVCKNVENEHGL